MVEFRKQEQRKFIEIVSKHTLNPYELIFEKVDNGYQFRYLDSGLLFAIHPTENKFDLFKYYYTLYRPDRKTTSYMDKGYHLTDVLTNFNKWLIECVKAYIDETNAPDPWQSFLNDFANVDESEKFSEDEIQKLEAGLDNFPKFLAEQVTIQPNQYQRILTETQELKKGLRTQTKRKWGKTVVLFIVEEVWDAVKDDLVMNNVKAYFFNLLSKSIEYFPKLINLLH